MPTPRTVTETLTSINAFFPVVDVLQGIRGAESGASRHGPGHR